MFLRASALLVGLVFASHMFSTPGCSRLRTRTKREKPSTSTQNQTPTDLEALIKALRAQGVSVERAGEVSQPFFSIDGQSLTVNGENVQVFQFPTAEAAEREASQVSPDGSSVGTSMITWMATPHFFKREKLIVLYVGNNSKVLEALRASLGAQFAGG